MRKPKPTPPPAHDVKESQEHDYWPKYEPEPISVWLFIGIGALLIVASVAAGVIGVALHNLMHAYL